MLSLLACLLLATPADVNVAASRWGLATATASSTYGAGYEAANVLDGRWAARETDKWNSRAAAAPHWLVIDLGREQRVHRVVIRHEGVFGEGDRYNTADFALQYGASADGPWVNLLPPVHGNHSDVTTHEFAPTRLRWLRLQISQGEQGGNEFARIFEVEVLAAAADVTTPLVAVQVLPRWRAQAGHYEQAVRIETAGSGRDVTAGTADAPVAGRVGEPLLLWLPVTAATTVPVTVTLDGGAAKVYPVALHPPGRLFDGVALPPAFARGKVVLMSSSHQDIAWMDSIERCIEQRDRQVIAPALDLLEREPRFAFVVEDTLCLMEYLDRHPSQRDRIARLTREGRLDWGATYNQPYEGFLSGEELVREVYFGRRWIRSHLPGCDARSAWSPDVPGRTLQMPQILAKSGVPYLLISRQSPGLSRWQSPDGSDVLAWSPGHYVDQWERLQAPPDRVAKAVAEDATATSKGTTGALAPVLGYLISTDAAGPRCLTGLLNAWPRIEGDGSVPNAGPSLGYATGSGYLDQAVANRDKLPVLRGERPNVWLYIHGPTHHQLADAKREAARLLPAAETFQTIAAVAEGDLGRYPRAQFDQDWQRELYPDHGFGGNYGELTDETFRHKVSLARDDGHNRLGDALTRLASRVRVRSDRGRALVVFNDLAWARSAPVELPCDLDGAEVYATDGRVVPSEILDYGSQHGLRFVAPDVPGLGYSTFYVARAPRQPRRFDNKQPVTHVETADYRLELGHGGLRSLFDKGLSRELLKADGKWLGGELFTMQSVGNGAGEFAQVQQPTMEEFDHLGRCPVEWRLYSDGPVCTVAMCDLPKEAQAFRHTSVSLRLTVWKQLKRVDLDVALTDWDGTPYREFRLAFPVAESLRQVSYEVPFGVVRVGQDELPGAAGERYTQPCRDVRPREVQNWFDASGAEGGLTISSSVAVFDWLDPTSNPAAGIVLQPLLLASRRSCHGQGNWYLQPGDHRFRFSLSSHRGDWRQGWQAGVAANHPLWPLWRTGAGGDLPQQLSFVQVSPSNLAVSTLKRAEDNDKLVLRLYDAAGQDTTARVALWRPVAEASRCNLIEDGSSPLAVSGGTVSAAVGHHAIETMQLSLKAR